MQILIQNFGEIVVDIDTSSIGLPVLPSLIGKNIASTIRKSIHSTKVGKVSMHNVDDVLSTLSDPMVLDLDKNTS